MSNAPPQLEVIHGGSEAEASASIAERDSRDRNLLAWALADCWPSPCWGWGSRAVRPPSFGWR